MTVMSPEQLAEWYEAYGAELLLFARQLTDAQQADDIVQEAFIKLLGEGRPPDNARAWLYRVVRNEAVSFMRRLRLKRRVSERLGGAAEPCFESRGEDLIDAQTVQSLLETLAKPQREIVVLRIWGQMTLQETAGIVHKPVSTVHHLYQKALEKMRQTLEQSSCTTKKK